MHPVFPTPYDACGIRCGEHRITAGDDGRLAGPSYPHAIGGGKPDVILPF